MIQARAATDAIERLALVAIGQNLGAAVVEEHNVKLVGAVNLVCAPGSGKKGSVDGEALPGGTAAQQLEKYGQILRARNQFLDPGHSDVNFGRGSGQPRVALVLHNHNRTRIGNQKVCAADSDVRRQELLA